MIDPDNVKVNTAHFCINISDKVEEVWLRYRQIKPKMPEAFGVLIGSKDITAEFYEIVEVTEPQQGDRYTRTSFTLKDPGHQSTVDSFYHNSGGELVYRGTWHTHPEPIPHASCIDIKDWKECKLRNKDKQLFFIIIGIKKRALYYFENETLLRQEF